MLPELFRSAFFILCRIDNILCRIDKDLAEWPDIQNVLQARHAEERGDGRGKAAAEDSRGRLGPPF